MNSEKNVWFEGKTIRLLQKTQNFALSPTKSWIWFELTKFVFVKTTSIERVQLFMMNPKNLVPELKKNVIHKFAILQ